ncbi:MAG TPA: hypothetical protein VGP15_08630, partial [Burkholderiales bacterium]|nr:hypothetical protein [Burkholderiales bacterium]
QLSEGGNRALGQSDRGGEDTAGVARGVDGRGAQYGSQVDVNDTEALPASRAAPEKGHCEP